MTIFRAFLAELPARLGDTELSADLVATASALGAISLAVLVFGPTAFGSLEAGSGNYYDRTTQIRELIRTLHLLRLSTVGFLGVVFFGTINMLIAWWVLNGAMIVLLSASVIGTAGAVLRATIPIVEDHG